MMKENNMSGIKPSHDDLILRNRDFIQELGKVQDLYYESLKAELGLSDEAEEFLWDYIFNDISGQSFEEFLSEYGTVNDNIVKTKYKTFNIYKS